MASKDDGPKSRASKLYDGGKPSKKEDKKEPSKDEKSSSINALKKMFAKHSRELSDLYSQQAEEWENLESDEMAIEPPQEPALPMPPI